jgi:hypothetical protein
MLVLLVVVFLRADTALEPAPQRTALSLEAVAA